MKLTPLAGLVYEAIPGFEDHLLKELESCGAQWERYGGPLVFVPGTMADNGAAPNPKRSGVFWYQNCWLEPFRLEFDSINEAASALRAMQRNWAASLYTKFRRGSLIASKLPPLSGRPRLFPWLLPETPVGAWTLLDEGTLLGSARCASPFPGGIIEFTEDKAGPPSRAYLKLWEALTRLRRWPVSGERCLDAGASPGGWTWALAKLGAQVLAIDRSPLEDRVAAMSGVTFIRHDAFTLKPEDIGPIDWLFCDVICYPPRLYEWIEKWLASGLCRSFVCTIKMQGGVAANADGENAVDFETPRRFAAIPGSTVVHLCHNKHELCWMKTDP
jgi:23S rRNA (cytidine2498-2'-O)-methyltransferase